MLLEERKGRTLAVDGKAVRSADGKKGFQQPLHIVSAQLSKLGVLASKSVDGSAMKSQRCRNVAAYGYCGMPGCGRRSELSKSDRKSDSLRQGRLSAERQEKPAIAYAGCPGLCLG